MTKGEYVHFANLPSCPTGLVTQPSGCAIVKRIKNPMAEEDGSLFFKDKDFPSEMKCVSKKMKLALVKRKGSGKMAKDEIETGEVIEEIEYIRTLGVLVQTARELVDRVEALEARWISPKN